MRNDPKEVLWECTRLCCRCKRAPFLEWQCTTLVCVKWCGTLHHSATATHSLSPTGWGSAREIALKMALQVVSSANETLAFRSSSRKKDESKRRHCARHQVLCSSQLRQQPQRARREKERLFCRQVITDLSRRVACALELEQENDISGLLVVYCLFLAKQTCITAQYRFGFRLFASACTAGSPLDTAGELRQGESLLLMANKH